ncbi:MAG: hypothetical protein IPK26_19970 [Planctomycetes bacterium]|nr:hypothetical protein [Planctomycetota bacterium]
MLEQTGALDVYFEKSIQILMADARPLREDAVRKILDESKVEFTRIQKSAP